MAQSRGLSWLIAASIFVAVSLFLFFIIGLPGGGSILLIGNAVSPTVAGETLNFQGGSEHILRFLSITALSLTGGLVAAAFYWFRHITPKREMVLVLIAYAGVASASGANFWRGDELISWKAQIFVNLVLAILSLSILIMLWGWHSARPTLLATKLVIVCLISTFGLFMPLIWTFVAILYRKNLPAMDLPSVQGMITLASGAIGLMLSLLNLRKELAAASKGL